MFLEFMWRPACEQLVEHCAQAIDISSGTHSAARHLLRAGIVGSQHAHASGRRIIGQVENLGDAEVRHPPQSGWLDELGRLKGGRAMGLGVARCAP